MESEQSRRSRLFSEQSRPLKTQGVSHRLDKGTGEYQPSVMKNEEWKTDRKRHLDGQMLRYHELS
ncbi:hypothetical protein WMY93_032009, partial [Mugilogobius chulae]